MAIKVAGMEVPGALERSAEAEAVALAEVAAAVLARCAGEVERMLAEIRKEAEDGLGARQKEAVAWVLDGVVRREVLRMAEEQRERLEEAERKVLVLAERVERQERTAERAERSARKAEELAEEAVQGGERLREMAERMDERERQLLEKTVAAVRRGDTRR